MAKTSTMSILDNPILNLLADGPMSAPDLFRLAGQPVLQTGKDLGWFVVAGFVSHEGDTFALTDQARQIPEFAPLPSSAVLFGLVAQAALDRLVGEIAAEVMS